MAVTMVIGKQHRTCRRPLLKSHSIADKPAVRWPRLIANQFSEASDDLHLERVMEIGLALFVVTLLVNALARATGDGMVTPWSAGARGTRTRVQGSEEQGAGTKGNRYRHNGESPGGFGLRTGQNSVAVEVQGIDG